MNKKIKIIFSILGACSVLIEIMTPLAVAIIWGYYFNLSTLVDNLILIIGGLASVFRGIKIGFFKNE